MRKGLMIVLLSCTLMACATNPSPRQMSELQQGQRYFETGYYKHAMSTLLPLACEGIAKAQYAVGYMYYYGFGVAQDTDVGGFWIERSAQHGYEPAVVAMQMVAKDKMKMNASTS